jgi:hypothetical protein
VTIIDEQDDRRVIVTAAWVGDITQATATSGPSFLYSFSNPATFAENNSDG